MQQDLLAHRCRPVSEPCRGLTYAQADLLPLLYLTGSSCPCFCLSLCAQSPRNLIAPYWQTSGPDSLKRWILPCLRFCHSLCLAMAKQASRLPYRDEKEVLLLILQSVHVHPHGLTLTLMSFLESLNNPLGCSPSRQLMTAFGCENQLTRSFVFCHACLLLDCAVGFWVP